MYERLFWDLPFIGYVWEKYPSILWVFYLLFIMETFLGFSRENITRSGDDSLLFSVMMHQLWEQRAEWEDQDQTRTTPLLGGYSWLWWWLWWLLYGYDDGYDGYIPWNIWLIYGYYMVMMMVMMMVFMMVNNLVGGWAYPSEKIYIYLSVGVTIPNWIEKIKTVPNHQPVLDSRRTPQTSHLFVPESHVSYGIPPAIHQGSS